MRLDRVCGWCERLMREGEPTVEIAFRRVHADPCAAEFDAWVSAGKDAIKPAVPDPAVPPVPLEQQLRKSVELGRIQDDDLVEWGAWVDVDTPNERYEREMVRWGDLFSYERHMVERLEDGRLVGGYPI